MRSRMIREGSVGLLILTGIGLFVFLAAWIKGFNPANRSFEVTVDFNSISGVQVGTPVRYRGVAVGRIASIQPGPNGVEVKINIAPANLVIPSNVEVSVNQSSLLGESMVDLNPKPGTLALQATAKPLDRDCDRSQILCDGSRLTGKPGISTEELIRSSIEFTNAYSNPEFVKNLAKLTQNSSEAAAEIAKVSREFGSLARTARKELSVVSGTAQTFATTAQSLGGVANRANLTLAQVNELLVSNRTTLVTTLDNLSQTSGALRSSVTKLEPAIDRVASGQLLQNLEQLSANAAQASANLKDASTALNNPANLALLQQTLDSARATFQNAQKITADLDDLVGDPKLRDNLRNLINGLSGLVSSSQQLQQQAQMAQVLEPMSQTAKAQALNAPGAVPPTAASQAMPPRSTTSPSVSLRSNTNSGAGLNPP